MGKKLMTLPKEAVFALDIGTRSIIGMLGFVEDGKMKITAIEKAEHEKRAMIDGQIEDIGQVALVARRVRDAMEETSGYSLKRVYVAAAGRALQTSKASFEIEFSEVTALEDELISRLETGAIGEAQKAFSEEADQSKRFFLVGYTVSQYYLDDYPISSLLGHRGQKARADIVATFLPGEVVESLYAAMQQADMEVAGLTLEPIAAMNAAIPEKLRLLNLVMVDIGAGTSDIAVCRDGKVVGYTMATLAGDEMTEALMKTFLVDFDTAERIKMQLSDKEEVAFTDILGFEQVCRVEDILGFMEEASRKLAKEIADRILEVNGGPPSAVFLAGGGSRMVGLSERITECLGLPAKRASVAGRYYSINAVSNEFDLDNPEFATPLGIVVSAGLNLVNDSFSVKLNGSRAKLFSNGILHLSDVLMMNGYRYRDMIGRSGSNVIVTVDGERMAFYGEPAQSAVLRVNGADAALSDLVHAGDEITFAPALSGAPARVTLSELPAAGRVKSWRVNGETVFGDYELKYGDTVETEYEDAQTPQEEAGEDAALPEMVLGEEPLRDMAAQSGGAEPLGNMAAQNGGEAPQAPAGEEAHLREEAGRAIPEKEEPEVILKEEVYGQEILSGEATERKNAGEGPRLEEAAGEKVPSDPPQKNEAPGSASSSAPAPALQPPAGLFLELNGQPVFLPKKADGQPYYLMDLLQFSGLDLEHLKAPVVLRVNGEQAFFRQEIKAYDTVSIYEDTGMLQQ